MVQIDLCAGKIPVDVTGCHVWVSSSKGDLGNGTNLPTLRFWGGFFCFPGQTALVRLRRHTPTPLPVHVQSACMCLTDCIVHVQKGRRGNQEVPGIPVFI